MNKIILLALVGMGFVVTTPFTAQAIDSEKIGQNLDFHSERLRQRKPIYVDRPVRSRPIS
jgi:hypothetical protein